MSSRLQFEWSFSNYEKKLEQEQRCSLLSKYLNSISKTSPFKSTFRSLCCLDRSFFLFFGTESLSMWVAIHVEMIRIAAFQKFQKSSSWV